MNKKKIIIWLLIKVRVTTKSMMLLQSLINIRCFETQ